VLALRTLVHGLQCRARRRRPYRPEGEEQPISTSTFDGVSLSRREQACSSARVANMRGSRRASNGRFALSLQAVLVLLEAAAERFELLFKSVMSSASSERTRR